LAAATRPFAAISPELLCLFLADNLDNQELVRDFDGERLPALGADATPGAYGHVGFMMRLLMGRVSRPD
jgi:hypothetical protein